MNKVSDIAPRRGDRLVKYLSADGLFLEIRGVSNKRKLFVLALNPHAEYPLTFRPYG